MTTRFALTVLLVSLVTPGLRAAEPLAPATSPASKYAVMPFSVGVNMDKDMPRLLDELLLAALSKRALPGQTFLGSSDITAVLGLEQQKQALGCDDEGCMAEIGNALGVDFMVVPAVGKLGDSFAITYKVVEPKKVQVLRRDTLVVTGNESALPGAMDQLADKILGTPPSLEATASAHIEPVRGSTEMAQEGAGRSPLLLAGVGVAVLGILVGAGSGAAVGWADSTLVDPASTRDAKSSAVTGYWAGLGGLGLGTALLVGGAALAVLGL
ncbi:MAG: hypothetical protein ABIJ09_21765 [Pseudomonadota bacterium]